MIEVIKSGESSINKSKLTDKTKKLTLRLTEDECIKLKEIQLALDEPTVSGTLRKLVSKINRGIATGWVKELLK